MAILSVDLAYRSWRDIGIAQLSRRDDAIICDFVRVHHRQPSSPTPLALAELVTELCDREMIQLLLIDGPQAWKDPNNGLPHSRICERLLNTPAKTGLPGHAKPGNYTPFVTFAISLFDHLVDLGWARLSSPTVAAPRPLRLALESFPTSAWGSLRVSALPAKSRTKPSDLQICLGSLCAAFRLELTEPPTHDELQALVAGLAGIAIETRTISGYSVVGVPPFVMDGACREGFIVNPSCAA